MFCPLGSAGFVKFYEIPHHGVRSVEIFTLQEEEYRAVDDVDYEQLFIAVAVDPFPKHDIYSRLLKIVNLGRICNLFFSSKEKCYSIILEQEQNNRFEQSTCCDIW